MNSFSPNNICYHSGISLMQLIKYSLSRSSVVNLRLWPIFLPNSKVWLLLNRNSQYSGIIIYTIITHLTTVTRYTWIQIKLKITVLSVIRSIQHWNRYWSRVRDALRVKYFIHDISSFIRAITVSVVFQWGRESRI